MKLLQIAQEQVGYLEKRSNKDLDSKTANAGSGNFTKYWRDMDPSMQGQPWCDCFVGWCFMTAYGLREALQLQCQGTKTYYTPSSAALYQRAGRWKTTPEVGAQIFFKNDQRINHTGIVIAYDDTTVTTIEGNTSGGSGVVANGGGVFQKIYKRNNTRIAGYGCPDFTEEKMALTGKKIINATSKVAQMAQRNAWRYGDSHALPPCADGVISCDRLIFRALWDLGYHDQRQGGETVVTMDAWLTQRGFFRVTERNDLKAGDIVLFKQNGESKPTWRWHTFLLTAYNPKTGICSKYDAGSQTRVNAGCFFANVPLDEWSERSFFAGYRVPSEGRLNPKGTVFFIQSTVDTNFVMDVKGGSTENRANLQIHELNKTKAQQFTFQKQSDGLYYIVNVRSGYVLDVKGGKAKNATNVWQHKPNATKAQKWKRIKNADGTISFASALNTRYRLDLSKAKAKNGSNIQIYAAKNVRAQKWIQKKL